MNPYTILAAVLVCAATAAGAYTFGGHVEHQAREAEVAQLKDQQHTELAKIDQTHRQQLQDALMQAAAEKVRADADMADLDAKFTKEIHDAKVKSAADVAAVRAGTVRLRDRFTCDGAGGASGGAAAAGQSTGVGDAAAGRGLRQEDAAILVQESDRADNVVRQLSACQAIVVRDRQAGVSGMPKP
jgi:hypothetical protein